MEYESCLDGLEAIEKVEEYLSKRKMFDIVLMDLYMPNMNGYNASKKIRELEKKYGIKESNRLYICGYSSQVSLAVEKKCFDHEMDDIIAKPMSKDTLDRMLNEHDRRKMKG